MRKRKIGNIILVAVVAVIAALLVFIPIWMEKNSETVTDDTSKLSAKVEKSTVTDTVAGYGSITESDAVEVTIPDGVKLTEYLVENGDTVKAGDALAKVDKVSVMTVITEVQSDLDEIESDMAKAQKETADTDLKTEVAGRVKLIYAQAGDSVRSVMDNYGALAVLSLDGLMVAEVNTNTVLPIGTDVTVLREDGETKLEGSVELCRDGVLTVTVTDESTLIGEKITVFTKNGINIGTGTLAIHNPWNVTAWSGTVKQISCKVEQSVKANVLLFRLENTSFTSEYTTLSEKHKDYEELMQELFTLYTEGVVYAESDGKIDGIDEDNTDIMLTAATASDGLEAASLSNSSSGSSFGGTVKLCNIARGITVKLNTESANETDSDAAGEDEEPEEPEPEPDPTTPEGVDLSAYTKKAAIVTKNAADSFTLRVSPSATSSDSSVSEPESWTGWTEGSLPGSIFKYNGTEWEAYSPSKAVGDAFILVYSQNNSSKVLFALYCGNITLKNNPDVTSTPPGGGSFGGFSVQQAEEYAYHSLEPVTVMNIIPQEKVTVTMSIDELDILSVSVGQEAQVTLDAVPGQSFTGTVTEIETTGSNSGGNTKFTVTMELDRTEQMVAGMNVSAMLTIDSHEDVLTVPTEALVEEGNKTYIYTSYDEENGLSGKKEVTTGCSDGLVTEITSGLKEGDTVWYAYYDTLQIERDFANGGTGSFSIGSLLGGSGGGGMGGGMSGGGGHSGGGGGHGGR